MRRTLRQLRYEHRAFRRNPASAVFTFAFPLMFLVIFNLIFGNLEIRVAGGTTTASTFYVPAIAAFSIITTCFTNLAMRLTFDRDQGRLKRIRGTPLSTGAFLAGKILHVIALAIVLVAIVTLFGMIFYGVRAPTGSLPAVLVTLAVGAAAFCALGIAITAAIPNADAAPAVVNATILPLLFVSDVFIRLDQAPPWLRTLGDLFPVKHLSQALQTAYDPFLSGPGFEWGHLGAIAAWGAAGLVVALRTFSWEPRR
ncbi:MAG TPA: ABC transporter permease [Actinomycetota bacterium]|nr:ABC transporter permease [Actinomycetota bacterium]